MHNVRKRGFAFTQVNKLAFISLTSSLSLAIVSTIWAVYLESFLKNASYVGFLTTAFTIISGLSFILLVPVIEKNSKTKIFAFSLAAYIVLYLLLAFFPNIYVVIILGIFAAIIVTLKIMSFGIIIRDKSKNKAVSKNISLIYVFLNFSWLIGPLIAGFLMEKYGFGGVFIISAFFIFLSLVIFKSFHIKDERVEKRIDKNPLKLVSEFLREKNRFLNYILSSGVSFWWALIYIYVPIYIIEFGLSISVVGYFLFAIVIPLILLEYHFGKLAAKVGFKKMFFMGYMIISGIALLSFFISNIYFMLSLLVIASIGAAMIEPTTEAHFFDIINKKQRDKYYGPYSTGIEVGSSLATLISAVILLFLPFKFIFIFFSIAMLIFALISLKIRNVIEARKKN